MGEENSRKDPKETFALIFSVTKVNRAFSKVVQSSTAKKIYTRLSEMVV